MDGDRGRRAKPNREQGQRSRSPAGAGRGGGAPRPGRCGAISSSRSRRPGRPRPHPQLNDRGQSELTRGGRQLAARDSRGQSAASRVAAPGAPRALIDLSAQASQPVRLLLRGPGSRAGPSGWSAPPAPGGSPSSPGPLPGAPPRPPAGIARPQGCPQPDPPLWAPCQPRHCSPCCCPPVLHRRPQRPGPGPGLPAELATPAAEGSPRARAAKARGAGRPMARRQDVMSGAAVEKARRLALARTAEPRLSPAPHDVAAPTPRREASWPAGARGPEPGLGVQPSSGGAGAAVAMHRAG
ncbi:basic salivary proline-rich protein 3-like [Cricetulus griseus]|uniref:Basic salivary proline-rich protein 3-like n=1 Tax=Cricetulus griseus TaxID=10029 RepID=A0A9J7GCH0_CRIGR|nr:basic salivary proline-rich protein 3-like [Cricetulus griseus]